MKINSRILIITMVLLISSCSLSNKSEKLPSVAIPLDEMNNQIHLYAPINDNTFKIGDPFVVSIENSSENQLGFQEGGIMVFEKRKEGWISIEIQSKSLPDEFQIYPKKDGGRGWVLLGVLPKLTSDTKTIIRIAVIGNILSNDEITDKQVGGYLDITMNP